MKCRKCREWACSTRGRYRSVGKSLELARLPVLHIPRRQQASGEVGNHRCLGAQGLYGATTFGLVMKAMDHRMSSRAIWVIFG